MKRILSFIILLIMAGCTQLYEDVATISLSEEFYATIEGSDADTRTYVDGNITTRWHADDRLTIFKKETYNREYKFKGKTGDNSGGFTQVSVDDDFYSCEQLDKNYAVYPNSNDNCFNKQTESFELIMPAEQIYAENTFGRGANTMVAVSETGQLIFKNVGSFLRVRLWGENTAVSSITITSNGDEVIAGEAMVKPSIDGDPTCVMTGLAKSITLNCPTPVTISESESTPTDFWIVIPPVTLEEGFAVTVKGSNDQVQTYEVNNSSSFERNKYYNLKREVTLVEPIDPSASIPDNEIWYTTSDESLISIYDQEKVMPTLIHNEYKDGIGIMTFDDDITIIGANSFSDFCINHTKLTSITIPNSVTSIGMSAFYGCKSLKSIIIPDGVTSIEQHTFFGCTSLTDITLHDSITKIGYGAFSGCKSLISITIPDGVTRIEGSTFYNCSGLEGITFPDGVISIGERALYGCSNLQSINIPSSVTSIGDYVFDSCTSLSAIYGKYASFDNRCLIIDGVLKAFAPAGLTSYTIPDDTTSIGESVFSGCTQLKNIYIPTSVTSIKNYSFRDCALLTNITIPNSVTSIGKFAFYGCKSLANITIPSGVNTIEEHTFDGCKLLSAITIPEGVTSIGNDAFYGCSHLERVTIPDSVTSIGMAAFDGCAWLTNITIPNSVTAIGKGAFWNCTSLTSITIPSGIIEIGDGIFAGCTSLSTIYGKYASADNRCLIIDGVLKAFAPAGLTSYTIPDDTTSIGESVFLGCSLLTSIYIPENVTSIESRAFESCKSLTSITIPKNVIKISNNVFAGCKLMSDVYCKCETPPIIGKLVFVNGASNVKFYVPKAAVERYQTADGWSAYANSIMADPNDN